MTIIKAFVCNPTISLSYPSHHKFAIRLIRTFPVSSTLLPINKNARSFSFQCRCTKEKKLAEMKVGSDSEVLTQCVPNLQTHWFIWMLLLGRVENALYAISKLTLKWLFAIFSSLMSMTRLLSGSKKKEPCNFPFYEVAGPDASIVKFQDIISILQGKIEYKRIGANLPEGVLLYGPPRTGKTTLVHAVAREAEVPFFPVSATDIAKVGTSGVDIKRLFIEARKCSPSIVFIKDIEAIAGRGGNRESDPLLFQLLIEMEKCYEEGNMVMVIASTNRLDTLDLTLMRDGRFFTKIHVGEPDEDGKRKIIGLHLKEVLKEEDRDAICNLVASQTPGFVWDDLVNIANRSIRLAARRGDDHVTMDDVLQALEDSRSYFNDKLIAQAYFNDKPPIAQEHMQRTMTLGSQN